MYKMNLINAILLLAYEKLRDAGIGEGLLHHRFNIDINVFSFGHERLGVEDNRLHRSNRSRFFSKHFGSIGIFPGKFWLVSTEMSTSSRFAENGSAELQVVDNAFG